MFGEKKKEKNGHKKISLGITRSIENYAAFGISFGIDFDLLWLARLQWKTNIW